ncbi:hypothetical protein B0H14DRAFT_2640824 [Mycena olivaceomarginata]|nr:hypothetical protein B0H14DRAFT_2640824 [Mycena olivaceomarginata]
MSPVQVIIERLDFFRVKFREIWPGESPGAKNQNGIIFLVWMIIKMLNLFGASPGAFPFESQCNSIVYFEWGPRGDMLTIVWNNKMPRLRSPKCHRIVAQRWKRKTFTAPRKKEPSRILEPAVLSNSQNTISILGDIYKLFDGDLRHSVNMLAAISSVDKT